MISCYKAIKNHIVLSTFFLIWLPTTSVAQENTADTIKHILVLNSYHQGYSWTDRTMQGVLSVFEERQDIELHVEYMDTKRKSDRKYFLQLRDLYKHKYEGSHFDAIISSDDHALDFLLKFRNELFPKTPVFFSGINDFKDDRISGHELFTGVVEQYDVSGTLDLILKLHPKTNLIAVVNDSTKSGIASGQKTKRAAEQFKDRVKIKYLTNLSEKELKGALSALPRDAIVLYITYLQPLNGEPISIEKSTQIVVQASNLPVYGYWDYILGNGILGGKVVSAFFQGEMAALMTQRYLNGEYFENIRVEKNSPNVYMFDYTALRKFNIDEASLPDNSILLNKPFSLYEQYKEIAWVLAMFFTSLIVTIFTLLTFIQKRRQADLKLSETNQLLQNVINSSDDLIFVKDTELRTILCNKAYAQAVGKKPEELYGNTDIENGWEPELVKGNPDKNIRGFEQDDKATLSGKTIHNPYNPANVEGETRIFDTTKLPLHSIEGHILGVLGVARDTTERVVAEEKLKLSARVFSDTHEGITITDSNKLIVDVNPAFCKITGYSRDEVIGKNPQILSSGKHSFEFYQDMWQQINQQGHWQGEILNRKKSGEVYAELLTISSLKDNNDNVINYVGMFADLTQLKSQQAQLQRSQKMDALGKLVGGIAHDYNNMLGIILGYTELITMKYPDVEGLSNYINHITQAGKRGENLTKRMLNFSKQESSQSQVVELNSILESQKELFERAVTARIRIIYHLCELPSFIWLDPSELEDALLNLTINAQHAMLDGGTLTFSTKMLHLSQPEAELLGLTENNYLKLAIADTGYGIDDGIINNIFDPFFSTKGTDGTGLGLSQVYGLMERAGGTIKVTSQKDIGSEFILYFPFYRHEEINDLKSSQDTAIIQQGNDETILVVDDEPALCQLAQEILTRAGYQVLLANDGDKAVEILAKNTVDLVLSDVIMPNMDGYQLALHIQEHYPEIKIQLASGFSDNRYDRARDKALHETKLHKPYEAVELLARIAGLLNEHDN